MIAETTKRLAAFMQYIIDATELGVVFPKTKPNGDLNIPAHTMGKLRVYCRVYEITRLDASTKILTEGAAAQIVGTLNKVVNDELQAFEYRAKEDVVSESQLLNFLNQHSKEYAARLVEQPEGQNDQSA